MLVKTRHDLQLVQQTRFPKAMAEELRAWRTLKNVVDDFLAAEQPWITEDEMQQKTGVISDLTDDIIRMLVIKNASRHPRIQQAAPANFGSSSSSRTETPDSAGAEDE